MDSVPVLFISGQASLHPNEALRVRGVQMVNIIEVVRPITKERCQLDEWHDLTINLPYLIDECLSERPGPCWLDVPLNVQAEEI
jgi:acetolactate synthase-1/2/3 large subunit